MSSTNSLVKSAATISASVDRAMDKQVPNKTNGAISIRNGPVEHMDVDKNGHTNGKRKSRPSNSKSYKDSTSTDDDDIPLVRLPIRHNRHPF
jgi:hypothetical protein